MDLEGKAAIRQYMGYTEKMVTEHPDRFLGCFVYNPRYGVQNGVDEIERYAKEFDFKMVQLQANMHAYRPDRALDRALDKTFPSLIRGAPVEGLNIGDPVGDEN